MTTSPKIAIALPLLIAVALLLKSIIDLSSDADLLATGKGLVDSAEPGG
ncbi:hypothetical protein [Pararhizobium qamdonense]|nr:hypothetical protein [Pararhizobium qamdonense]